MFRTWITAGLLLLSVHVHGVVIISSGFDSDLEGWSSQGTVTASSGFVVVEDAIAPSSALFDSIAVADALYRISFDFLHSVSTTVPSGFLSDFALVTLYLGDAVFVSPSTPGSFDEFIPLFDLDSTGLLNPAAEASIVPHPERPGWQQFTLEFATGRSFVTPHFRMVEQNSAAGDSVLAVDTVVLEAIPEPSFYALLLSLAAGGLAAFVRSRSSTRVQF